MFRCPALASFALALALGTPAASQALLDIGALQDLDDVEVVTTDRTEVGEIEEVLIDPNGNIVAVVVETEGRFLDIGSEDVVFSLEQLAYENGDYVTSLTAAEIEALPRYD